MCVYNKFNISLLFSSMRIRKLIFDGKEKERSHSPNGPNKINRRTFNNQQNTRKKSVSHQMEKQKRILFLSFQGKQQIKHTYIYKNGQIVKKNNKKRARKLN